MAAKKVKSPRKLERHFKGVANHRRIQILQLIARNPDINVDDISLETAANMKTIAEHTRRLVLAGLVEKHYAGRKVRHRLTPYGRVFFDFIETFSHSQESESI